MNYIWKNASKEIIFHKNKLNLIESCIDQHIKENPNKLAFVFENEYSKKQFFTYSDLNEKVNQISNYFNKINLKKSRVFLFLPKSPEIYFYFLAAIKQGSIAVPLFEAFETQGLELRLNKGNADVLVTNKFLLKRLKNKPKNLKIILVDSEEHKKKLRRCSDVFSPVLMNKYKTACMIFTSSTAGTPVAGVQIPHIGIIQQHYTSKLVLDLKPEDKYWCTAHPGWVTGGIYGIIAPLSIGCTTYVYTGHFDSKKWISFMKEHKINVIYTAPTALRLLKPDLKKSDLVYIKNICSVGEALTKAVYDHYKKLGITINDTYWQTETGAIVIASWPGIKSVSGSIGKPIPGIQAKIKNNMILLKKSWPAMMTGIYKHPKLYKSYFKGRWFLTNDSAIIKNNYYFFTGRKDDIIKTSGERVSPIEVESALMKHNAVKETAVIGIPDKIKGSIIKAFVVLNKPYNSKIKNQVFNEKLKKELMMFVKKNYAGHSYPKQIEFLNEFPKTNSGKIIKMKLKEI